MILATQLFVDRDAYLWALRLILVGLIAFPLGNAEAPQSRRCSRQDAIKAEEESSSLHSWADVFRSYKRYKQCDDAAIGEGYSDSVARLLSEEWVSTPQLNRLVFRDKGFENFVLRHVDELMTPVQAQKIRNNAEEYCPKGASRLCKAIVDRILATGPSPSGRR